MPNSGKADEPTLEVAVHRNGVPLKGLTVKAAIIEEALSELFRYRVDFLCKDRNIDLRSLLGQDFCLSFAPPDSDPRKIHGKCVSAEYIGTYNGEARYVAEVRPRMWFLTRRKDCRIFQAQNVIDIIQSVLQGSGLSANFRVDAASGDYPARAYCVQYDETDFAFISRLMEEEGLYYYFLHSDAGETMVIADMPGNHQATPGANTLEHTESEVVAHEYSNQVFEWAARDQATTGKVSLSDYYFENTGLDLRVTRARPQSAHATAQQEAYDFSGHYKARNLGERYAKVRVEAEAITARTWHGVTNSVRLTPGLTFKLKNGPRASDPEGYLVTRAVHYLQREVDARQPVIGTDALEKGLHMGRFHDKTCRCVFEAIPQDMQFRAPLITPWPELTGVHTAVVTGPAGEEIYTDKYGRVKVQFHWDREGTKNENSSIWVRTMMPWTGKGWGMIAIPRIGQEVVVQFEQGDPDRPIVVGMVYNGTNMPPYSLPEHQTRSGVLTNSSKGGSGANELMFEDKKGSELVRFVAEKDYLQVIENNARIVIGQSKKGPGDLTQWVHRNRTSVTGMIDSDLTGGVKSTAVGGAIAETVLGMKTQSIGYHKYETVGFKIAPLPLVGWAIDGISAGVAVGGSFPNDQGESAMDDLLGSAGVIKAIWDGAGSYGSFVGPAMAAIIGAAQAKGLKPGKTEDIYGNSSLTVTRNLTANGDRTVEIKDGDHLTTVKKGKSETTVKKDMLITVNEGKHFLKVEKGPQLVSVLKGDRQIGVAKGDLITGVDSGNYKTTVSKGNHDTAVSMGNVSIKASKGKIELEALQKIVLKVGPTTLELSPTGLKISAPMVNIEGKTMAELKSGITTVVKGGFVLIN